MSAFHLTPATAFQGSHLLATGPLAEVALAVRTALADQPTDPVLTFDDTTGKVIDLDLRGSDAEIIARLTERETPADEPAGPRGRGRPKLGVVAREVTLLPRHWDWLAAQPGGASVVLRKLVEDASRTVDDKARTRARREATYRFMSAMGGDLAGFEEATRALFAGEQERFAGLVAEWPEGLRDYTLKLATAT